MLWYKMFLFLLPNSTHSKLFILFILSTQMFIFHLKNQCFYTKFPLLLPNKTHFMHSIKIIHPNHFVPSYVYFSFLSILKPVPTMLCKINLLHTNVALIIFPPHVKTLVRSRAGNLLIGSWVNCSFFAKSEGISDLLKKNYWFTHGRSFLVRDPSDLLMVAHFWWGTWVICSHHSFLVSDLSNSLTLLTKNEGMSKSLIF